eukprot:CAMPEP_0183762116 /NCGR_PEP_ID=MMETSP0739-20130205/8867_1 /TAXON_ID=385413 /ORGANISM="Thalassiosira miniscula, Strain CCMP1093" /LENGTH=334 /DNA_ID=CAMNT_0026000357 /DNA_START=17 /DNA_END=1018 /DNA_ORIENTATION=+
MSNDIFDKFSGTGVGGRLADVLTQAGIPTSTFSVYEQQVVLTGEAGKGQSQFVLSSSGLPEFNPNPSINNMDDIIKFLNNDTAPDSGFHAATWSQKLSESLIKQEFLRQYLDATVVNTSFPEGNAVADQFKMVTRIMQTYQARGSLRDVFYVQDWGYDSHADDGKLIGNLNRINFAIEAFVSELRFLDLWESTVVVQFSEFARTLSPNSGSGTEHGWGGHHFMFGGAVKGGRVLGQYPVDFEEGDSDGIALSRGRIIPTLPWDAMWKGTCEWFGILGAGPGMDKVLPMHRNFPPSALYNEADLFHKPATQPTEAPSSGPRTASTSQPTSDLSQW